MASVSVEPLTHPTTADLAAWLASVPMTEALWNDIQKTDVGFERCTDLFHDALSGQTQKDRLGAYWRGHEALAAYLAVYAEMAARAFRNEEEPLPRQHAETLAGGMRLCAFLGTPSGERFQEWHQSRKAGE